MDTLAINKTVYLGETEKYWPLGKKRGEGNRSGFQSGHDLLEDSP